MPDDTNQTDIQLAWMAFARREHSLFHLPTTGLSISSCRFETRCWRWYKAKHS